MTASTCSAATGCSGSSRTTYAPRPSLRPTPAWSATTCACRWCRRVAAASWPPPTDCASSPPSAPLNSGPNPKYFGTRRRGVPFYNFLADQFSGLHGILIPGTQRDSFYILDGLLEQEIALRPVEITSDTHGASDRLRPLPPHGLPVLPTPGRRRQRHPLPRRPGRRLRPAQPRHPRQDQPQADITHWNEMLRLAGSLHAGIIKASDATPNSMRSSSASARQSMRTVQPPRLSCGRRATPRTRDSRRCGRGSASR